MSVINSPEPKNPFYSHPAASRLIIKELKKKNRDMTLDQGSLRLGRSNSSSGILNDPSSSYFSCERLDMEMPRFENGMDLWWVFS